MSNMMSPARKALLQHLADLPPNRALQFEFIADVAGISPQSVKNFRNALIEDELAWTDTWLWPNGGTGKGLKITDKGRAALKDAVLPEADESRKADDRSIEVAKIVANPLITRANVRDLHHLLLVEAPERDAKRNLANVEELLSLLNGVVRLQVGRQ